MLAERGLEHADRGGGARRERESHAGGVDREAHDAAQGEGAVVLEQCHPRAEGSGHDRRQLASAGNQIEAEPGEVLGGRRRRAHTLTAQHPGRVGCRVEPDDRNVAAQPAQVRLHDLQREPHRDGSVEGRAALLQDRHSRGGWDRVCGCRHAEGADELGPGREVHQPILAPAASTLRMIGTPGRYAKCT